jgi:hypothetical protein
MTQVNHTSCEIFHFLLWHTERIWNKKYNTEYSYKLLTFKAIPEVSYGSLPTMGKAENLNSISAISSMCANHFPHNGCFSLWIRSQLRGLRLGE